MPKGSLEIIEFEPRRVAPEAATIADSRAADEERARVRLGPRAIGRIGAGLGAVTLHSLLLTPVILGVAAPRARPPDRPYAGEVAMQWVVLEDSPLASANAVPSFTPPLLAPIAVTQVALEWLAEPLTSADSEQQPDQPGLAALYGRYTGQIQARIERAWERPRTSPGSTLFRCQVEIDQDENGHVGAVTLVDCDGGARWQLSLVRAIEAASPLPAPPVAAVFAKRIVLNFTALPYGPGALAELYEPAAQAEKAMSEASLQMLQEGFRSPRGASQSAQERKVIELRIDGSAVEVEEKALRPRR